MPHFHFKCDPCRVRASRAEPHAAPPICPACGAVLEPVSNLEELVGLRIADERWLDEGEALALAAVMLPPERTP